ncbi:heterokaryon incompatibility protein-domain-containing protein [Podospora aff. communis PSN243]|uniref:Heterokaryon incompatibility protein-domain-containing protein n=1 Tax=Podospora aff. communis PSN243 TaxID=3040156 RepID=A0AAV9GWE8_9PEZI|nr:heterokaryon incompatibility protein-domain-containing protein [Podospora aff. communis PSN243]
MLCDACKTVPWGRDGWKDFFLNESFRMRLQYMDVGPPVKSIAYDIPSQQFYAQAQTCEWCALLSNELKIPRDAGESEDDRLCLGDFEPAQERITNISITIRFLRSPNVRPERLAIIKIDCLASTESGFNHFVLRLGAAARAGAPAGEIFASPAPPGPEFSGHDGFGFKADLARKWLSDCTQHHTFCSSNTEVPLPTRLLHLFDADDGSTRVVLKATGTGERGSYACLSYSWGTREGLQDEFALLGRRLSTDSLPLNNLPTAFRDAVQVCRGLGLQYLWADALCIQQGDEADKSRELRAMHLYYGNARVVIQPSGTTSVDETFLGSSRLPKLSKWLYPAASHQDETTQDDSRAPTDIGFIKVPFVSFPPGSDYEGDLETDVIILHELRDLSWYYSWGHEAAASRGWILQEELLCSRILNFPSTGGITYRCIGSDTMLTDGNVFCHPEYHQPLSFPKLRLWNDAGHASLGLELLSDHLKGMLQQARRYVGAGPNHALVSVFGTSGALHLNHDFSKPLVVPEDGYIVAPVYSDDGEDKPESGALASTASSRRSVSQYTALIILPPRNPSEPLRSLPIYTDSPPNTITPACANRAWLRTVDNYCRRRLTNPGDKMPAIAALARGYSARYGAGLGRYIVGAWEAFMAEGLCWSVPPSRVSPRPRPANGSSQRAPSWSWAAVEGAYFGDERGTDEDEHDLNSESIEIKIKSVRLVLDPLPDGEEPSEFEGVGEGVLGIEGKLIDCDWLKVPHFGGGYRFVLVEKRGIEETRVEETGENSESEPVQSWKRSSAFFDTEDYVEEAQGPLRFLLVRRSNRGIGEHDDFLEGLLLKPVQVDSGEHRRYVRVGSADLRCKKGTFDEGVGLRFRQETLELV